MTGGCSPSAPLSELTVEFSAKAASVNVASCRVRNLSSLAFSSSFAHNSSFLFLTRTGSHSHGRRAMVVLSQQLRSGSLPEISEDGSEVDRGFENDNEGAPRNRAWRRPQEDHWRKSENSSLLRTAYRRRSVDAGVQQPKGRLDLLREKQPSRLHNRFTVFERVTDPKTLFSSSSPTESGSYASESSEFRRESSSASPSGRNVGISAALRSSSTPSALDREPSSSSLNSPGDGKSTSQFTSKLQEILENFKKKDQFARRNDTAELELFQRNFRRGSSNRGRHDINGPAHVDGNNDADLSNHADVSSTPHESLNNEESGTKGGPPSFNLFSNAPPVPRDFSQRRTAFPGSASPNGSNVFARRLSRSIGSRSSPSRSSIPGKRSKYSKPDPKSGQTKTDVWRLNRVTLSPKEHIESHDASELDESDVDMPQDSLLHTDKKSLESGLFEWSDSDSENDAEDKSVMESVVPSLDDVLQSSCDDFSHSTADADANLSSEKHIEQMPPAKQFKHEAFVPFTNQHISDLPFEVQFSYSETPNAPIIGYREPQFSPFGPTTMSRPWTGRAPLKPSKKKVPEFDSFNPPPKGKKGIKYVQDPGPYHEGEGPKLAKTREEILGEPLSNEEIVMLVDKCQRETRQLNLGRDGLTHNMLDLVHQHWKRRRVCRIKCKGVPTLDMDNVCFHLEDKTGGKIIYRTGGTVYLFRGRNYNYKDRPRIPLMLWKPHAPIYPKLIQAVPEGLTKEQTYMLRLLGSKVEPLCKLNKNGVYLDLVKEVRNAFKVDDLVRIDCEGLNPSDYKKIGAKLRDLVPCVLLSFRREQILMWKGRGLNASSGLNPLFSEEKMETVSTDNNDDSEALEDSLSIGKGCSSQLSNNATKIMCDGELPDQQCDDGNTSDVGVKLPYQEISKHDIGSEESPESKHLNNLENFDDDRVDTFDMSFEEDGAALEEKDGDLSMMMPTVSAGDKELHLMERETSTNEDSEVIIVKVDVLWEQALKSGIAMVVDETDLDADLVFEKATELADRAPSGPVYTQNMIRKLAPKKEPHKSDELHIHFGKLNQLRKKKQPKRKRPLPTIDVPAMGGLPVDQLARLLSPN